METKALSIIEQETILATNKKKAQEKDAEKEAKKDTEKDAEKDAY